MTNKRLTRADQSEGYWTNRIKELTAPHNPPWLAREADVSVDTIRSLWYNEQAVPVAGPLVARLSKALGVAPHDLLKWNDPVPTSPQAQGPDTEG